MTSVGVAKDLSQFDTKTFLSTIDGSRKITDFAKKRVVFIQGDSSDAVFYVRKGKVRLTVVAKSGKEATTGILNEGDFFGEGCLTGQPLRLSSATAMIDCFFENAAFFLPPSMVERKVLVSNSLSFFAVTSDDMISPSQDF